MTLKSNYTTGINSALTDAFAAGKAFVVTNNTVIALALADAATLGKTSFTIFIETAYSPEALKLNGALLKNYLAGIYAQLSAEDIQRTEISLSLDTSVVNINKIKFTFNFA